MARKAVQGYTEKSYYDNTRFLGMIATNDPLNEGAFKHLVNFNISDTAQSVKPRDGYITTTLNITEETASILNAATYTSITLINGLTRFSSLDPQNTTVGVVNEKLFSFESGSVFNCEFANSPDGYFWVATNDFVSVPLNGFVFGSVYFDTSSSVYYTWTAQLTKDGSIEVTTAPAFLVPGRISLSERTIIFRDHVKQAFIVFDFDNLSKVYVVDLSTYQIENYFLSISSVASVNASTMVSYLNRLTGLSQTTNYYFSHFVLETNPSLDLIYDEFGVRKYLLRASIVDENINEPCMLEFTYNGLSNVLLCSATFLDEHPNFAVKNLASTKDFLPPSFQTVYTNNRPVGHVNLLGVSYVRSIETTPKYYNQFIFNNQQIEIVPYFELNPANFNLTDSTAKWAYRFEITNNNTSTVNPAIQDIKYLSSWFNYDNNQSVFSYDTSGSIFNQSINNHYKESEYIFTIYSTNEINITTGQSGALRFPSQVVINTTNIQQFLNLYGTIFTEVNKIQDRVSFFEAFENLRNIFEDIRIHVYKWTSQNAGSEPFQYTSAVNVESERQIIKYTNIIETNSSFESEGLPVFNSDILSGSSTYSIDELITEARRGVFGDLNIAYKIMPINVRINYSTSGIVVNETRLYTLRALKGNDNSISNDFIYSTGDVFAQQSIFIKLNINIDKFGSPNFKDVASNLILFRSNSQVATRLRNQGFFKGGYTVTFYIRNYEVSELTNLSRSDRNLLSEGVWMNTALVSVRQALYGYDNLTVTELPIVPDFEDALRIRNSKNFMIYKQNRLVIWSGNNVYISDAGAYYLFRLENKQAYTEQVVKVIEYKNILLVFTVQHLYALYETIFTTGVAPNVIEQAVWTTQRVLYNILTDLQYAEVIQVFNDMILFYSSDGQMFLIKPNTMIDNETRFTLKYFNKAVNDVLLNYDVYMRERMRYYDVSTEFNRDDIVIKSLVSVNFIKIMYTLPNVMTYILIYDVLNNRYYVYDTLTFHTIKDTMYVDSGDMYLTHDQSRTLFTFPYKEMYTSDQVVDMTYTKFFQKEPIYTLIDTGNMNLNNHLMKRFRDLHVIFKNINASNVSMNIETVLDDIVATPYYDTQLEVKEVDGTSYFVQVANLISSNIISELATNTLQYALDQGLFENQNLLMDFSDYSATKLLTHRSTIVGMGKSFRLKLQFVSKGDYKIQAFGIIYKERRV